MLKKPPMTPSLLALATGNWLTSRPRACSRLRHRVLDVVFSAPCSKGAPP
jgi:hypothetical protein